MRFKVFCAIVLCAALARAQETPAPTPAAPAPAAPSIAMPKITMPTITAPLAPSVPSPAAAPAPAAAAAAPSEVPAAQPAAAPGTSAQIPAAPAATAAAETPATGAASSASAPAEEPPPPPAKDPAKCVVARFSFDGSLQPEVGGSTIPVVFNRISSSYLDGTPVSEGAPRFIEGRSGKAVMLESAYGNLFSIGQSAASEAGAFKPVQGAALSISADKPWQGKEALAVETKGETGEEGFSAEALVEKAFYTKESGAIVPAYYVASLFLKGQGNLKLVLKDVDSGAASEPVYIDLQQEWQRFSCLFEYPFRRINIGPKHEADWRNSLPAGTNINSHLQLICTTVDSQKMNFSADGLQLEQRNAFATRSPELSPHTWVLGALSVTHEQLAIDVRNDYFKAWKKAGSIAFWFKPLWEARDNSLENIVEITKNQLMLSHDRQKLIFAPAGVAFTPSEWRNNWHHVVITWNEAGERALYVDGMDYPNTDGQALPMKDPETISAGDPARNLSPNGALDELVLYNITLNPDQAKALCASEPAPAARPAEAPAAPAAAPQPTPPEATAAAPQSPAAAPAQAPAPAKDEEEEEE
ncbi:MAG: LamG-like jellyroll fold domain-containing protein, partial [Kiritimatiellia bacterium]